MTDALHGFSQPVRNWFAERIGEPTEVQQLAWPRIAAGEHLLAAAPTGSGKTLTAFLWALDRLLSGSWEAGHLQVLYISPLKALNNDIQRNLLTPLAELEQRFEQTGIEAPTIRAMTRSGDTPQSERQKMVRRPPEILITTPESLNILLTSKGGRSMLTRLRTVIVDEVHAVAGNKRGTHLITAIERLVPLSGEFQRIALSATARPLETVAQFVGGYTQNGRLAADGYEPRPVAVVQSSTAKEYDLAVTTPATGAASDDESSPVTPPIDDQVNVWDGLSKAFLGRILRNQSTLLFANSRRTTEKITRLLNDSAARELAYSHHGSLSREIRTVVEQRLKNGELEAIVATNSLELGIDVGALDEVILLQTPPSIASAVQRLGRAGHQVGAVSRGKLFPLFDRDFLDAAVVAESVLSGQIEAIEPVVAPLDVLAQIILSMTCSESWQVDELFAFLRTTFPYHLLTRKQFDLVLEMLAGRYASTRVRELEPRISYDRIDGTVKARRGTDRQLYMSGGTIPDRGYFHLRTHDTRAKLGELDEEFVWERSLGDSFTLGAQSWRIREITHNDVLVAPSPDGASMAPFWRAEERNRSFFLSERLGEFLERAEAWLGEGKKGRARLSRILAREHCMEPAAIARLFDLLDRQRAVTYCLPHRHRIVAELVSDPTAKPGELQAILHTFWGGRVNRPWAMALTTAWEEAHGTPLRVEADNDCVAVTLPAHTTVDEVLELVRADDLERLLRKSLEGTGLFGALFRENAGRALLLPRSDFRRRVPLWLTRERSKKLLDSVRRFSDFPIVVETWRACLQDEFELDQLRSLLDELADGAIERTEVRVSSPSPFAEGLVWKQTNRLMYESDLPEGAASSRVRPDLLAELASSSHLRPRLPASLLVPFQEKLHRVFPGYSPRSAPELLDWVKERQLVPADEWAVLMRAIERDHGDEQQEREGVRKSEIEAAWLHQLSGKLAAVSRQEAVFFCAVEDLERLHSALDLSDAESLPLQSGTKPTTLPSSSVPENASGAEETPADERLAAWLSDWLRFYGPLEQTRIESAVGIESAPLEAALTLLGEDGSLFVDQFREDDERLEICDRENLERLLRLLRASRRVSLPSRKLEQLPLFLATHQRLTLSEASTEALQQSLESLIGYSAPAASWEDDLLPARLDPYYPAWLDSLFQESDLAWHGSGRQRLTFLFPEDRALVATPAAQTDTLETGTTEPETPSQDSDDDVQAANELDLPSRSDTPDGLVVEFPATGGRYSLEELARPGGHSIGAVQEALWGASWHGEVANTTFAAVRRGILNRFQPDPTLTSRGLSRSTSVRRRSGTRSPDRWRRPAQSLGDWFHWPELEPDASLDALEREERNKQRARIVLERYGVVFRELLLREPPALRWSNLFRSFRLMELSGEVFSGLFFDGIAGVQFASRDGLALLRDGLPDDAVFWINALDPAAPSGLGLDGLREHVPARLRSNHTVYHGSRPVVISRRFGAELEISVAEDHPLLEHYLDFLKAVLTRPSRAVQTIDVESINDEPAHASPYRETLGRLFEATRTSKGVRLRKRFSELAAIDD